MKRMNEAMARYAKHFKDMTLAVIVSVTACASVSSAAIGKHMSNLRLLRLLTQI